MVVLGVAVVSGLTVSVGGGMEELVLLLYIIERQPSRSSFCLPPRSVIMFSLVCVCPSVHYQKIYKMARHIVTKHTREHLLVTISNRLTFGKTDNNKLNGGELMIKTDRMNEGGCRENPPLL